MERKENLARPTFSIVVVCLNPGDKLVKTLDSIVRQSYEHYEVIIKDGMSTDGTVTAWEKENRDQRFRVFYEKDRGIYEAMNQAAAKARGELVYFLNCGDLFYHEKVLEEVALAGAKGGREPQIVYGNIFEARTGQQVASNPKLDRFGCYRNVPCHQACFYSRELLTEHPFETALQVRADYEQFLWCALDKKVRLVYLPLTIASYEGGGFSEKKESRRISAKEHREVAGRYLSKGEMLYFRGILLLTLAPVRSWLAENKQTAAFYQRIKGMLYHSREK